MTPDPLTPDPPACVTYQAVLNRVLDGELPPARLRDDHAAHCPDCGGLASAARVLLRAVPATAAAPPAELAERIVTQGVRQHRRRRLVWAGTSAALAVSVLLTGYVAWPRPVPPRPELVHRPGPTPRVGDQLAEAGSALAAMTRKAAQPVTAPTRLLPPVETVSLTVSSSPGIEPATDALSAMPSAAKSGLEPVTSATRRAVTLFLRDFGINPSGKPKT